MLKILWHWIHLLKDGFFADNINNTRLAPLIR